MKGFAIFTNLCLMQSALAEPKYTPQIVPKCTVLEITPGEKRCIYTLDEVRVLYHIDLELIKLQKLSSLQTQKIIMQKNIIDWQREQLKLSEENTALFHKRTEDLTKQYLDKDRKLQMVLAKPRWGHYMSWAVVAMFATLFTGYVVADQISK